MFKRPLQYLKKKQFFKETTHLQKKNLIWTQHDFLKFFCNVPICCYFGTQFNQVQNSLDGKQSSFSPQSHMQQAKK